MAENKRNDETRRDSNKDAKRAEKETTKNLKQVEKDRSEGQKSPRQESKEDKQRDGGRVKSVVVNENENEEATANTTVNSKSEVKNTDKLQQNKVSEIPTTPPPNEIAKEADAARTQEEIRFANEGNPNQKGRNTLNEEKDQDGNVRTEGKSYGVASDDPQALENTRKAGERLTKKNYRSFPIS